MKVYKLYIPVARICESSESGDKELFMSCNRSLCIEVVAESPANAVEVASQCIESLVHSERSGDLPRREDIAWGL